MTEEKGKEGKEAEGKKGKMHPAFGQKNSM